MINKLTHWYFSKRALPYWGVVSLDSFIVMLSVALVAALTEGTLQSILHWQQVGIAMLWILLCYIVGMRLLHTYDGVIRYSSFVDLHRVGCANLIALFLTLVVRAYLGSNTVLGYVDLCAVFIVATMAMWVLRVLVKFLYETSISSRRAKRVFIYGVKQGGISLAKGLRNEEKGRYILAGFITDDLNYVGKRLMGVRVVKNDLSLVEEMKLRQATVLLVSPL